MSMQLNKETDAEIILRIADLMEVGSEDMEQGRGMYFIDGGVCAIGACLKAVGITKNQSEDFHFSLLNALGFTTWPRIEVPKGQEPFAYSGTTAPLIDVIIHLNDKMGWSFEKIINWLRSLTAPMVEGEQVTS